MAATYTLEGQFNLWNLIGGSFGAQLVVGLYQNNIVINASTLFSALVEADYPGYARYQSASWAAPAPDPGGDEGVLGPVIVFQCSGGSPANMIFGYFVGVHISSTFYVLCIERFMTSGPSPVPAPISMALATDQIPLRIQLASRSLAA